MSSHVINNSLVSVRNVFNCESVYHGYVLEMWWPNGFIVCIRIRLGFGAAIRCQTRRLMVFVLALFFLWVLCQFC